MARQVNIHEAKTHLSRLAERASRGEEIVIARNGEPVAKLGPIDKREPRKVGVLKGKIHLADDFDAPLPDELQRAFEGQGD